MKKLIVVLLCLLGIVYAEQVTVLAINDMHANIDRLPQLATFVKQEREEHPELLLLSAGDNRTGNPYVDTGDIPGLQMIQLMNKLGFNASAYGNHEFDSGLEALRLCTEAAAFPFVCANVQGKDGADLPVVPYCFFERHGVRIGVMGLVETSKDGTPDVHPDRVTQLVFEHPFNVVRQYVFLREQCDVLILLTHIGFGNDVKLAALFPEADAIIGGHTHTRLENGHVENGVLIVQAERDVKYITRLSFDVEDGKVRSKKAELVSLSGYSADAEMQKAVEDVKNNPYMQRCIAHIQRDIPSRDSLGCLMADAQRAATGAQIALVNRGNVRLNEFAAGPFKVEDCHRLDPFGNKIVLLQATGRELIAFLNAIPSVDPHGAPSVAGMRYKARISAQKRTPMYISEAYLEDGTPIVDDVIYTVAVNSYLLKTVHPVPADSGKTLDIDGATSLLLYLDGKHVDDYSSVSRMEIIEE